MLPWTIAADERRKYDIMARMLPKLIFPYSYIACYCALAEGEQGKAEIARDDFWKRLVPLSQDNVIDVRIGVARLLGVLCGEFCF